MSNPLVKGTAPKKLLDAGATVESIRAREPRFRHFFNALKTRLCGAAATTNASGRARDARYRMRQKSWPRGTQIALAVFTLGMIFRPASVSAALDGPPAAADVGATTTQTPTHDSRLTSRQPSAIKPPPSAEIIQLLPAGKAGVPEDFDAAELLSVGDFFYAVGPSRRPTVHSFKRDRTSGQLSYAGSLAIADQDCTSTASVAVGNRLYFLLTHWVNEGVDNRLAMYSIDPATGKPAVKGVTEKLLWTDRPGHTESAGWGRMIVATSDQKNVYVTTDRTILKFDLEADGKPRPAGQFAGKGFGEYLFASPDGKWLYTLTHKPAPAIACLERKPGGELALKSLVNLDPKWATPESSTEFSISISPDGKWLYAADWNVGQQDVPDQADAITSNCYLAVFRRDPASGALTLAEAGCGNDSTRPDFQLANSRQLRLLFNADGGGFIGTASGSLLRSFACDRESGRITTVAEFPEWDTRRLETHCLWLDNERGLLYGASGRPFGPGAFNVGAETHGIWVAQSARLANRHVHPSCRSWSPASLRPASLRRQIRPHCAGPTTT